MKSILLIADTVGWIFHRHCKEIKNRIPEYYFDIKFTWQNNPLEYDYSKYDLIYQLDPMTIPGPNPPKNKTIIGLRNEFMYESSAAGIFSFYKNYFEPRCCMFHVVNKKQYKQFSSVPTNIPLLLVQHGVDTSCFCIKNKRNVPKTDQLVIGISGNSNSSGEKGFSIVEEACAITGCKLQTARQNLAGTHLTKEQMSEYYNNIDIYCCMSKSEGLNNCVMEAGATAVPVITTRTGAVEEMIRDGVDGFIVERNVDALVEKLNFFKANRQSIVNCGLSLMENIKTQWSWDVKIKDFKRMFDRFFKQTSSNWKQHREIV